MAERAWSLHWKVVAVMLAALLAAVLWPGGSAGADRAPDRPDRPERGIVVYTDYSHLVVPVGETVRMTLTVDNRGRREENVALTLTTVPRGWQASLRSGQFTVRGVPVAAGKSRALTFTAEPDEGLRAGTYTFELEGRTADGVLTAAQTIVLTTEARRDPEREELKISTSYPVLRGPTDSSFEFSLEVSNTSAEDRVVNVAAEAPRGWDVAIKPGWETKQITSLRIRAGANERVALELKPPRDAQAGEYPVVFRAATDRARAEARLQVELTGIYRLDAVTPTGRLSLDAVAGRPSTTTLVVRNTGSAVNRNVRLTSFAPENWKVEFQPDTLAALEPGSLDQVEVTITPAAQALVGDYSVALTADGEKSSKTVELRTTVRAPATWAWVGVGIIAAVIGGLGGLFTWLGRR